MTGAKETIAGVFGRAAHVYDEVEPRMFSFFGRRLVELAALRPEDEVLDVATGRGAVLFPAAERARSVVGIDLAEPMVRETAARLRAAGATNADVAVMDAERLEFADASFDAVFCGFAIFFLDEPDAALREWQRVLRADGLVGVTAFERGDPRWDWLRERMRGQQAWRPARRFETADDLRSALEDAELAEVRVETATFDARFDDGEHWLRWAWTHGQRGALERMSDAELEAYKTEVFPRLELARESDGKLHNRITAVLAFGRKR